MGEGVTWGPEQSDSSNLKLFLFLSHLFLLSCDPGACHLVFVPGCATLSPEITAGNTHALCPPFLAEHLHFYFGTPGSSRAVVL